jgi:hypothetical protein
MAYSTRSIIKKARPPLWWGKLIDLLPRCYLPFLEPKRWTPELAKKWINAIPSKCPFERQIWIKNVLVLYIPPLCSLNPLSTQLYSIRLKAQAYLASLPPESV